MHQITGDVIFLIDVFSKSDMISIEIELPFQKSFQL